MKLPEIQYGPVQSAADAPLQVGAAAAGAADKIAEGLTRYGMELVKTETMEASADLALGLEKLKTDLASRRYFTTQELRDSLGADFDSLPPEVKAKTTQQVFDIGSGQMVDAERDDIPVWEVAGSVFDLQAKRLLDSSSKRIRSPGWRGRFANEAQDTVLQRKAQLNQVQIQAMHEDQLGRQKMLVAKLTKGGEFDQAEATVSASSLFTPAEKEQLVAEVATERQRQPFNDRVLIGVKSTADVLEAGKLIQRLEGGEGVDHLDDKERIQRKRELEQLVQGYEHDAKYAQEHAFDGKDGQALDLVTNALIASRGRPLPFELVPPNGEASPKMREHLYKIIADTKKGGGPAKVQTDPATYEEINRLRRDNPKAFVDHDLLGYMAAGKLSITDFKKFSDLQTTIRTEGLDSVKYQSFNGPQEETDRLLLERGVQVKGSNISEREQKIAGYVRSTVDNELYRATVANGGKPLDLDKRNGIIQGTVAREWQKKRWGRDTAPGADVDPMAPDAGLRRIAARRGVDPGTAEAPSKDYQALAGDYEGAVPAIDSGWRAFSGKPLRQADALGVFELMRRDQKRIDDALTGAGKAVTDANRAAVAAQLYLGGAR